MKLTLRLLSFCLVLFATDCLLAQDKLLSMSELNKQKRYTSIAEAIKAKEQVTILILSNQRLTEIPQDIYQLQNIQFLDLRNNQLTSIPKNILSFKHLQYLIVSKNSLASLPSYISELTNLRTIDVSENKLSVLPSEIVKLLFLEELNIENNRFQKLSPEVCKIKTLKVLKIWDNPFSEIPVSVCTIDELQELYINGEQILSILNKKSDNADAKITLKQCVKNESMLDENGGNTQLESMMGSLAKLKKLHIKKNGITPEQIKQIENALNGIKIIYY